MISIETAKNLEDLFQIKSAIMGKKLEEFGGRKGVAEILGLAFDAYHHQEFQKSLKILDPLVDAFKDQPFVSNDDVEFVSVADEMEWSLCLQYHEKSSSRQVKNVSAVCPMEFIWRQYSLSSLELGDYVTARDAAVKAVQWNPASAKYRLVLAMACGNEDHREESLGHIVSAMKSAYKPVDLVYAFQLLRDYFTYKGLYNEAMYMSFLRSNFISSSEILRDIVNDMLTFIKNEQFNYQDLNDEGLLKTCEKYGFAPNFNPEVVAVAQRNYEEAFVARDAQRADYFAQIMSDMKTEQEKRNAARLRRFFERRRNIMS